VDVFVDGAREAVRLLSERDRDVFHALGVSLVCAALAVVAATALAVPYGGWLALRRPGGHRAQVVALRLLLSVPTVVIGLVLYGLLSRRGLLGDLDLLHTRAAIAIGQALLAFPLIATQVHAAAAGLERLVVDEARTLGAGPSRLLRLGLGEIRPSVATALLAALGRCLTELGIALIVGGGIRLQTRTLPGTIALEVSTGEFGRALAPALLLLLVALPVTLAASAWSKVPSR
jgi:tungstate transport system permease protein